MQSNRKPAQQADFKNFSFQFGELYCEDVPVSRIADDVGSPAYIYSAATLRENLRNIQQAFNPLSPLICFSVKSLNNLHVLRLLSEHGCGMDIVSGGELFRALRAGIHPNSIVYAGVGKNNRELMEALDAGVGWINVESTQELVELAELSTARRQPVRCALRINPDLEDAHTHQKTFTAKADTKFGIDITEVASFAKRFGQHPFLQISGLHFHLGSPIYDPKLYAKAIEKSLQLIEHLGAHGVKIDTLDIGGGFCSVYGEEQLPPIQAFSEVAVPLLQQFVERGGQIILEPGRSIAATAGILLSEVLYTKQGRGADFAVLDTGMSHLIRPALYDAFHFMWPVMPAGGSLPVNWSSEPGINGLKKYDIVGPICETGDLFARNRLIPELRRGDRIAIFSCGAYGMTMASHYNAVCNPVEVLVDGNNYRVIRRREQYSDLVRAEEGL